MTRVMPPEQQAFVRAIVADPADDTARLVYADWLDDNGRGGRAAWVRETWDAPRTDLDLWAALAVLTGDTLGLPMSAGGCVIRRGFIEAVSLTGEDFMRPGFPKRLFACQPVTKVTVRGVRPRWNRANTWVWNTHPGNRFGFGREDGAYIPTAVAAHLTAHRNKKRQYVGHANIKRYSYGSEAAALDDLGAACVRYGRFMNGLPALPPGVPA